MSPKSRSDDVIIRVSYSVRPSGEMIVQPFSSKVSRTALLTQSKVYRDLAESSEPLKPFRVTALKEGNRPLYSSWHLMRLLPDKDYSFEVTSLLDPFLEDVLSTPSFTFSIYGRQLSAEVRELNVLSPSDLILPESRLYRVDFVTPTLLQFPRPNLRRKRNRYSLFPYPPLLLGSLAMHWNKFLEPKVSKVTGSRALYFLKEVDYRLRPMTVRYDEGRVRGFVGWTLFSLEARKGSKLRENLRRMLAYSNLVGVGKSRSVGFGEVRVRLGEGTHPTPES
jgi:CRISPR-associated endoribonuclease Cas6